MMSRARAAGGIKTSTAGSYRRLPVSSVGPERRVKDAAQQPGASRLPPPCLMRVELLIMGA